MKQLHYLTIISLLIIVIFHQAFGQNKDITVSGTVTNTTENPVSEACVILYGSVLINETSGETNGYSDTVFTDNNGYFSTIITVNEFAIGIMYTVLRNGYTAESGYGKIENNKVNIGTIILTETVNKRVTVYGTVVDSVTGKPIYNALVVLSITSTGVITNPGDTLFTDANGNFSNDMMYDSIVIGTMEPMIVYLVQNEGYKPKLGSERIITDYVNLGQILLEKLAVPIKYTKKAIVPDKIPDNVMVYSLKGQLLYCGPEHDLVSTLSYSIARSQPIIICYKFNNKILYMKKITIVR